MSCRFVGGASASSYQACRPTSSIISTFGPVEPTGLLRFPTWSPAAEVGPRWPRRPCRPEKLHPCGRSGSPVVARRGAAQAATRPDPGRPGEPHGAAPPGSNSPGRNGTTAVPARRVGSASRATRRGSWRWRGMSRARQVLPGQKLMVTRRCTQRQFLLRPDGVTNEAVCTVLASRRRDTASTFTVSRARATPCASTAVTCAVKVRSLGSTCCRCWRAS